MASLGPRPVNQECAQVGVAALADAKQRLFAACPSFSISRAQ